MASVAARRVGKEARRLRKMRLYRAPRPQPRIAYTLPDDLFPTKVNGAWRAARISAKRASKMRKQAKLAGTYGMPDAEGGWDPEWDRRKKTFVPRMPKGHKRDRTRDARLDNILAGLDKQEKLQADWRKNKPRQVKPRGLLGVMKMKPSWWAAHVKN